MNTSDDALEVRETLCHLPKVGLESWMVHKVLHGIQTSVLLAGYHWASEVDIVPSVDISDLAEWHAEPNTEETFA